MEIYESYVKQILKKNGVPIPKGGIAYTPEEACRIAEEIGGNAWVVKAQVMSFDRYKGKFQEEAAQELSGIVWANAPQAVAGITEQMLGRHFLSPEMQGVPQIVERVYVEEACHATAEMRLSLRIDFVSQNLVLATEFDGQQHSYTFTQKPLSMRQIQSVVRDMGWRDGNAKEVAELLQKLYALFVKYEAIAVEFSPVFKLLQGGFSVLNARIIFDTDSLFRYPDVAALQEFPRGREREAAAQKYNFRYTQLDGNIACLVNGVGLGLATIDMIHAKGGRVACLLDVGTEPTKEAVSKALRLALSEPSIDGVLVNIYGGITRCDTIAEGIISAAHEVLAGLPFVVRMAGTNAHIGRRLLFESRMPFVVSEQMDDAVTEIIHEVQEVA